MLDIGLWNVGAEPPLTLASVFLMKTVFIKKTDARVKGGSAPTFQRPISSIVQVFAGWNHVFHGHARGHQALVGIAENDVGDLNDLRHAASTSTVAPKEVRKQQEIRDRGFGLNERWKISGGGDCGAGGGFEGIPLPCWISPFTLECAHSLPDSLVKSESEKRS